MLRYLRRLADRDLALDRTMIPLGSCTMKLNATTEMEPITWPEFAGIHPVRAGRADRGLHPARRRARGMAVRGHRLRRGVAPAERGLAGGARGPPRDPRVPPPQRRRGTRHLPDPGVGPRHERGECGDGRDAGRGGRHRRRGQRRSRRSQGEGVGPRRRARRADGDLPVDPRCVRDRDHRDLRPRARVRRAGLRRRREPQRARRHRGAGSLRRRRVAPQPAQDVLHPPRRRGTRHRSGRGARRTSRRSCPAIRSTGRGRPRGRGRAGRLGRASSRFRGRTSR